MRAITRKTGERGPTSPRDRIAWTESSGALWVREPLLTGWSVAYRYVAAAGSLAVAQVVVYPEELEFPPNADSPLGPDVVPDGGLTARALRKLRVSDAQALAQLALAEGNADSGWQSVFRDLLDDAFAPLLDSGRSGSVRQRGEARLRTLATVAARYVQLAREMGAQVNVRLAAELGLTPSQVRDRIYEARNAGLLTSAPGQGRPGGALTEKAEALLERMVDGSAGEPPSSPRSGNN